MSVKIDTPWKYARFVCMCGHTDKTHRHKIIDGVTRFNRGPCFACDCKQFSSAGDTPAFKQFKKGVK